MASVMASLRRSPRPRCRLPFGGTAEATAARRRLASLSFYAQRRSPACRRPNPGRRLSGRMGRRCEPRVPRGGVAVPSGNVRGRHLGGRIGRWPSSWRRGSRRLHHGTGSRSAIARPTALLPERPRRSRPTSSLWLDTNRCSRARSTSSATPPTRVPTGCFPRPSSSRATSTTCARCSRTRGRSEIPVTFRAAGTSLSGQAQGDGILIDVRRHWSGVTVEDGARRLRARPGTILSRANLALAPHGYRLGPDPASAAACTIGGVIANNSSGMCCGTTQNSYRTRRSR